MAQSTGVCVRSKSPAPTANLPLLLACREPPRDSPRRTPSSQQGSRVVCVDRCSLRPAWVQSFSPSVRCWELCRRGATRTTVGPAGNRSYVHPQQAFIGSAMCEIDRVDYLLLLRRTERPACGPQRVVHQLTGGGAVRRRALGLRPRPTARFAVCKSQSAVGSISLVATHLDGTLWDENGPLPKEHRQAVTACAGAASWCSVRQREDRAAQLARWRTAACRRFRSSPSTERSASAPTEAGLSKRPSRRRRPMPSWRSSSQRPAQAASAAAPAAPAMPRTDRP